MRRYLGLSVEAAGDLVWWEHALLHEQLLEDKPWELRLAPQSLVYAVLVEQPEEEQPGDLAELGFDVRTVS
jgi:hypothetical protein